MEKSPQLTTDQAELFELIGEHRAFSRVADSCSAADAECIRRIRIENLNDLIGQSWEAFCPTYLGISRSEANKIIQRFEEFGASYFEISRVVRISPESYRAIAWAVHDNSIEWNGDRIELTDANAPRIAAAVRSLRSSNSAQKPAPKRLPKPDTHLQSASLPTTAEVRARIREIGDQFAEYFREIEGIWRTSPKGSPYHADIKSLMDGVRINTEKFGRLAA
jgi:hypothetical protein